MSARVFKASRFFIPGTLMVVTLVMMAWIPGNLARADANVSFSGTLIDKPPCTINADDVIKVQFGDKIGVNKVNSGIYRQLVPLELQCEEGNQAWQLQLRVRGIAADFDSDNATVISGQQKDLGIKLFLGGKPFPLDKPVPINDSTLPVMEALLIKRSGGELTEGEFTAQATLRLEFQ